MKSDIQRRFIEEIEKRFGFLKPTFRGPFLGLDAKEGILYVYFVGPNLAVEFILDERDEDIACKISRVIDGKLSPYYAVDHQGKLLRAELWELLRARGIREKMLTSVEGLSLEEQISIALNDYARMLQKYGQMVLEDNPKFLDVEAGVLGDDTLVDNEKKRNETLRGGYVAT